MAPLLPGLQSGFGLERPERSAVCLVKSEFGIGPDGLRHYSSGTGFLYRNDDRGGRVLTAGHNLFSPRLRRIARWVTLYFECVGDDRLACREATSWIVPPQFADSGDGPPEFDYGVVRIRKLGEDRFAPIALGLSTATGATAKRLCGYPNESPVKGRALPYHADFEVFPVGASNYGYESQATYVGMSGGPLIASAPHDATPRAWGLHIRGEDEQRARAVRFSQTVLDGIEAIA